MKKIFKFYNVFLLFLLVFLICIFENFSVKASVDDLKITDNVKEQCNCKNYPDIEPYIENHNEFWGSNAQMIYWSKETLKSLYKRYEKLYVDIIRTYAEDAEFIDVLKTDKKAFENYRNTQKKLVYPHVEHYGIMKEYYDWNSDYTLTVQHIEQLKQKINSYCLIHSSLLKDDSICKKENVNKIFDSIKLKKPKPIISTPYDKKY